MTPAAPTAGTWLAGVDGCRGGWVVVLRSTDGNETPRARLCASFAEILALDEAPVIIAIDMPIGLAETTARGGRACEIEARKHLAGRQSSVFSVPARAAVMQTDYAEACAVALLHSDPPRKVSKQCFGLFPKIREIDALMTPDLQDRVYECHPELAFWALNDGAAMSLPKKVKNRANPDGIAERRALLMRYGFDETFLTQKLWPVSRVGPDDFIDACALVCTAARIHNGTSVRMPDPPPRDARGLRIEINA